LGRRLERHYGAGGDGNVGSERLHRCIGEMAFIRGYSDGRCFFCREMIRLDIMTDSITAIVAMNIDMAIS
jgi:hypothetical protein